MPSPTPSRPEQGEPIAMKTPEPAASQARGREGGSDKRIFGLKIPEWGVIVALTLSLVNTGWSVSAYLLGDNIKMLNISQVELRCNKMFDEPEKCEDEKSFVAITVDNLAFINTGQAGYNGYISDIELEWTSPHNKQMYRWKYFSNITPTDWGFSIRKPILVEGKNVSAEEVVFYPEGSEESRLSWPKFRAAYLSVPPGTPPVEFSLKIISYQYVTKQKRKALEPTTCTVRVEERARGDFGSKQYISLPCLVP